MNRCILNPAQGLESGRDEGEVRVMTYILTYQYDPQYCSKTGM